jgi:hypothetical protein
LIRDRATDANKREMFDRLQRHFNQLADEVERAMAARPEAETDTPAAWTS